MSIETGDVAPDFTLPALRGGEVKLSDFRDKKNVVLFFYPRDSSPGCTREACTFRDAYDDFAAAGAEVIGISNDSLEDHATFASRHNLPMQLLTDAGGKVRAQYGIKRTLGLIDGRETFIIDKQGIVRHVFRSQVRVYKHVEESLAVLQRL
ncbi:MAG: alkyl hydroperoxide reductase [Myxococcales bacterium]|nr:alkyl hydroperoxide reductase [Myxococcales bacterium]